MEFVVHTPYPYTARSGGVRALYVLADELRRRGHAVAIGPMPQGRPEDPCPQGSFELVDSWTPARVADAVHVYPEIASPRVLPRKTVCWQLGHTDHPAGHFSHRPEVQIVAWVPGIASPPDVPRLMVRTIEDEFLHPKTQPGKGVAWWKGKADGIEAVGLPMDVLITHHWPDSKQQMGDLLRSVDLLVSFDNFTAINYEATLCGTPVLIAGPAAAEGIADTIYGHYGYAYSLDDLPRVREEVLLAHPHYLTVLDEISHDVDDFVDVCGERFGESGAAVASQRVAA